MFFCFYKSDKNESGNHLDFSYPQSFQNGGKTEPKGSPKPPQMVPKSIQVPPRVPRGAQSHQNGAKWCQNGAPELPKWCQNGTPELPKWIQMVPKWKEKSKQKVNTKSIQSDKTTQKAEHRTSVNNAT